MGGILYGAYGSTFGTAATDLFGQTPPSPPNIQVYQPQYTSQADQSAFSGINTIQGNNPYAANQATYQSLQNQGLNNPYAGNAQTAANSAGAQYAQTGQQAGQSAAAIQSGVQSLLPYMSQIQNTAADPQNALYNQQYNQLQNQAGVVAAQQGLTGSPYAASVQNNANNNFNINWQNNQLNRQIAGLSAAGTALGQSAAASSNAANTGAAAAADTGQSGQVPYANYNENLQNQNAALNMYGASQNAANANTQLGVSDYLNYLSTGIGQSNQQAGVTQQNYLNQSQYINAANQGIAGLMPGYSSAYAGGGGSGLGSYLNGLGSSGGGDSAGSGSFNGFDTSGGFDSSGYAAGGSAEAANSSSFLGSTSASSDAGLYDILY